MLYPPQNATVGYYCGKGCFPAGSTNAWSLHVAGKELDFQLFETKKDPLNTGLFLIHLIIIRSGDP